MRHSTLQCLAALTTKQPLSAKKIHNFECIVTSATKIFRLNLFHYLNLYGLTARVFFSPSENVLCFATAQIPIICQLQYTALSCRSPNYQVPMSRATCSPPLPPPQAVQCHMSGAENTIEEHKAERTRHQLFLASKKAYWHLLHQGERQVRKKKWPPMVSALCSPAAYCTVYPHFNSDDCEPPAGLLQKWPCEDDKLSCSLGFWRKKKKKSMPYLSAVMRQNQRSPKGQSWKETQNSSSPNPLLYCTQGTKAQRQ